MAVTGFTESVQFTGSDSMFFFNANYTMYDLSEVSDHQGQELDYVRTRSSRTPRPILRRMSVRSVTPLV